jgi:hypothetical protein
MPYIRLKPLVLDPFECLAQIPQCFDINVFNTGYTILTFQFLDFMYLDTRFRHIPPLFVTLPPFV